MYILQYINTRGGDKYYFFGRKNAVFAVKNVLLFGGIKYF